MKIYNRCFREFDEEDVLDVSPATELADYLDSRFHGNDRGTNGNDKVVVGNNRGTNGNDKLVVGNDRGGQDEDISDLCPECREEFGVMNLPGFGQ